MGIEVLTKDLAYFESQRAKLLVEHPGKVALIKDQKLVGVFDSDVEAYNKGLEMFGIESFLFKPITEKEVPKQIPALSLGLLNARF